MKTRILAALLVVVASLPWAAAAKEKEQGRPPALIGWLDLQAGSRNISVFKEDLQKVTLHLAQGALLTVFKTREKHAGKFAQVGVLNFGTGNSELGWVEIHSGDLEPPESYPLDSELLRLLGSPYLQDFTSEHTDIARFLVRQAQGPPALLCYVVTVPLSMAKLVIFTPSQGKYLPGDALNFPISEMEAGITSIEVRDLVGDGSECVVTKEPFPD